MVKKTTGGFEFTYNEMLAGENFPMVRRTKGDLEFSYNEMLGDDKASCVIKERTLTNQLFMQQYSQKETLSQIVTPVLHIRLGIV